MAARPARDAKHPADQPESMTALDSHLGFWLRFVSNHVSGEFRRRVESKGIQVSEWVALRQLFDEGSSSAVTLMETLGMTKGAISKVVARLEAKGLVQRLPSETDGRAQVLSLTPAGQRLLPKLSAIADDNDAHFFGHLTAAERQQLEKALKDLVRFHQLRVVPID